MAACVLETRLLVAALHQQLRAATAGRAAGLQLLLPTMPEGVELPAYSPQAQARLAGWGAFRSPA